MSDGLLSDAAVAAIQNGVRTETIEVSDTDLVTRQVYLPPAPPGVTTLVVATLAGIIDFIKTHDGESYAGVHIVDHCTVQLVGPIEGRHNQRATYVKANALPIIGQQFRFGQWYDPEEFNIYLQALFVDTGHRGAVLQASSSIRDVAENAVSDDGTTQVVTARKGVSLKENVPLPNPVDLAPYRTFREVGQPVSPFILRAQEGPQLALFEADGGQWKLTAIANIKQYLQDALTEAGIELQVIA